MDRPDIAAVDAIKPARLGHESDFELFFFEHYQRVFRLLVRLTGDRGRAEELANEVFWRLSRQPATWLLTREAGPWLYRTASNLGIDALRSANQRAKYETRAARESGQEQAHDDPLKNLLRAEIRTQVQRILAAMKPVRAQLLVLRSCGFTYKEVAEALNVRAASVGTLLSRAEEEFRTRYLALTAKEKAR
jgi:RNA polymerase sigma-70 factor (ECF subfamily)